MKRLLRILFPLTMALLLTTATAAAVGGDMVLIAHRSVPVDRISKGGLSRLYLRGGAHWPDGTAALPFDVAGEPPHKLAFYRENLERSLYEVRAQRARQIFTGIGDVPDTVSSFDEMIRRVAATPGAVGYVPAAMVDGSVRALAVEP